MTLLIIAVQWIHVFFATWWFGSILVSRLTLFPALRRLGPETESAVRGELVRGSNRRWTIVMAGGTVLFGALRGVLGGVLDRLGEPYGITYLASLLIGVAMFSWIAFPLPAALRRDFLSRAYVAGFPVMFTLMILMRFGY